MTEVNFSQLNNELEEIMVDLQSGDQDIDVVIKKYERGMSLIDKLEKYLAGAENKIKKLQPNSKKTRNQSMQK